MTRMTQMKILIADSFPQTHQRALSDIGHILTVDPGLSGDQLLWGAAEPLRRMLRILQQHESKAS